jgi:hypothetical protein
VEKIKEVFERLVQEGMLQGSIYSRFSESGLEFKIMALHYFLSQGVIEEKKFLERSYGILGIPAVSKEDLRKVDRNILMAFPRDLLEEYWAIPLEKSGNSVTLAMFDPFDQAAKEEIKFFTNLEINPVFLPFSVLQNFFDLYLNLKVDLKTEAYYELLTSGKGEDKKETKPPEYTQEKPQVSKAEIEVVKPIPLPQREDKAPEPPAPVTLAVLSEENPLVQAPLSSPILQPSAKAHEPIRASETHPISEEIKETKLPEYTQEKPQVSKTGIEAVTPIPLPSLIPQPGFRIPEPVKAPEPSPISKKVESDHAILTLETISRKKEEREFQEVKKEILAGEAQAGLTADRGMERRTETDQVEFEVSEATIRSNPNLQEIFISQYLQLEIPEKAASEAGAGVPKKEDREERGRNIIPESERKIDKKTEDDTQLHNRLKAPPGVIGKNPELKAAPEPKTFQDYRLERGIEWNSKRRIETDAKRDSEPEDIRTNGLKSGSEEVPREGKKDRIIERESPGKIVEEKPVPSSSELRPPRRKLKLSDISNLLEKITNRDDIIDLYLKVSSKFYPRLVLFTVQKNNLKIWRETGFGLNKNQLKSFSLPLDLIPPFREVFETQKSFIGELGSGEATKYFFNTFFFGKPKSSLLVPVIIHDKVGCIFYADNGRGMELNPSRSVTILENLSADVGLALGRIILDQKQKQKPD